MCSKVKSAAIRTARKDRKCTGRSYHTIRKGDRYLYAASPPWHEFNDSGRWMVIAVCLKCADHYGLHTSETMKQLEGNAPLPGVVE